MTKPKVFLTGADPEGWALDTDQQMTSAAIENLVELVDDIAEADIIHTVTWMRLIEPPALEGWEKKFVIAHVPHDPRHMLKQPSYLYAAKYVDLWVAQSRGAEDFLAQLELPVVYAPYQLESIYQHLVGKKDELRRKYDLPVDKYLIGSFHRDTEGADLKSPKYIKGPDLFLQIVRYLHDQGHPIHVVLAGPRRHWLRKNLAKYKVPFTFIGEKLPEDQDDVLQNTLSKEKINELYNTLDLYLVTSRFEGGPRSVLECATTRTKVLSTPVGHAPDVLNEFQICRGFMDFISKAEQDVKSNTLEKHLDSAIQKAEQDHSLRNVSSMFKKIYAKLDHKQKAPVNAMFKDVSVDDAPNVWQRITGKDNSKELTIHHQFHKPPWGGGNQFLLALSKQLEHEGWQITHSTKDVGHTILFNSYHIDQDKFGKIDEEKKRLIHRIDGPTFLIRDKDLELDEELFELNNAVADISVMQSIWSLQETLRLGFRPVNPVLISNAPDNAVFNCTGRVKFSADRKVRLISSSWSDNKRKGGATYKWLDQNLDWDKYEYTFVGRTDQKFENIKLVDPVPSNALSDLLKDHDIYLTASDNDPCSNAVVEALSCGLPVVYFDRGGHPELVEFAGMGFDTPDQIPEMLDQLVVNYKYFSGLLRPNRIEDIAAKYEQIFAIK